MGVAGPCERRKERRGRRAGIPPASHVGRVGAAQARPGGPVRLGLLPAGEGTAIYQGWLPLHVVPFTCGLWPGAGHRAGGTLWGWELGPLGRDRVSTAAAPRSAPGPQPEPPQILSSD